MDTPDHDEAPPISENEAFYDAEIAPALLALGNKLEKRGMSLVATVEYDPGERASTFVIGADSCLAMQIARVAAMAGENFDGLAIGVLRNCQARGIDTSSSMFLSRFSKKDDHA